MHAKSTGELISFVFSDRSKVWSQRNAQRIAESKRKKNDSSFWLIFGLSPNLGLGDSLSERLIHSVEESNTGGHVYSQTQTTKATRPMARIGLRTMPPPGIQTT